MLIVFVRVHERGCVNFVRQGVRVIDFVRVIGFVCMRTWPWVCVGVRQVVRVTGFVCVLGRGCVLLIVRSVVRAGAHLSCAYMLVVVRSLQFTLYSCASLERMPNYTLLPT